jgi:hypothetical protein
VATRGDANIEAVTILVGRSGNDAFDGSRRGHDI